MIFVSTCNEVHCVNRQHNYAHMPRFRTPVYDILQMIRNMQDNKCAISRM